MTYNPDNINSGDLTYDKIVDPSTNVKIIVDNEKDRLTQKEVKIDQVYYTKIRKDEHLRSETSRKNAYYRIFFIFVIIIILCLVLYYIRYFIPIIPDFVIELLYITVVAGGIIVLILSYMDIQKRSRMDFDKIDFSYLLNESDVKENKDRSSRLFHQQYDTKDGDCKGEDCCPVGSVYVDNRCVSQDGFTTSGPRSFTFPYYKKPSYESVQ